MSTVFLIFAVMLTVLSVLPLWRNPHWIIRAAEFIRTQLAMLAALSLALQLWMAPPSAFQGSMAVLLTLACLLWNLYHIVPFTPLWPTATPTVGNANQDYTLSILVCNVLMTNRRADDLIALVREHRPDILITLESDAWWQGQLETLRPDMPYVQACPLDNLYGMHLYSRLPLLEPEIGYLVEDDVPSIHTGLKLRCGRTVRLHALHPRPPSPTENAEAAPRDAELIVVARSIAEETGPAVVAGDFNDVPWSRNAALFRKLSGMLNPRQGRGLFSTYHAGLPMLRWPLDHVYHSEHFGLAQLRRLRAMGSDHFPLLVRLQLIPGDEPETGPPPEQGELAHADEVIQSEDARVGDVPEPGHTSPHGK